MSSPAFDRHAEAYDAVAESALGLELRSRVHHVLNDITAPGDRVLDLGCGSGIDAAWLAPQVDRVTAVDASAEMLLLTKQRCAVFDNVATHQLDLGRADLAHTDLGAPFDVALANFGVVNCVGDLGNFGQKLAQALSPGGYALIVTMARWCPIELGIGVATGNRELTQRRRSGQAQPKAGYDDLAVTYASASVLAAAFAAELDLVHAESLGLALPPFEQRSWVEHRPRLRRALAAADRKFGSLGARVGLGDHHLALFRRAP